MLILPKQNGAAGAIGRTKLVTSFTGPDLAMILSLAQLRWTVRCVRIWLGVARTLGWKNGAFVSSKNSREHCVMNLTFSNPLL